MTLPVLICDDSGFAQKQIARALPEDWPISLSFAKDGVDALQSLKEGKGVVLFLDLTMPNMDGYQVLEAIKSQGLKTKVIVVSGDIQPDAYKRVISLGALEFIKKPVDIKELHYVIEKFAFRSLTVAPLDTGLMLSDSELFDGYREIANVAMGRAAGMLAKLLDCFVIMPIPKVNMLEVSELRMVLGHIEGQAKISAICQGFIGNGIAGEALLIFNDSSFHDIAELMQHKGAIDDVVELELLMDMASILIGAVLKGFADQLDVNFSQGHPIVLSQHGKIADLIKRGEGKWRKTLSIELGYSIENRNINSDLLLLFTEDSIPRLAELITYAAP